MKAKSRFSELKSNQRVLRVRANYSKRHFTIVTPNSRWRTIPLSQEEFNSCDYMTGNDWEDYLKNSNDYYAI